MNMMYAGLIYSKERDDKEYDSTCRSSRNSTTPAGAAGRGATHLTGALVIHHHKFASGGILVNISENSRNYEEIEN